MSRIEAGAVVARLGTVDLTAFLEQLCAASKADARLSGIPSLFGRRARRFRVD